MSHTSRLALPFLREGARHNLVRLNQALTVLDAVCSGLRVAEVGTDAPPGTPVNGDTVVIGSSPTGAFAGQDPGTVAIFTDAVGWTFIPLSTLGVVNVWDDSSKSYKFQPDGYAEAAPLPLSPDLQAAGVEYWSGMHTADGRQLMRKKITFSTGDLVASGTADKLHAISGVLDLGTVFISGMARGSTEVQPLNNSFKVSLDADYVHVTTDLDNVSGWSVDVFIDFAVEA